jgi:hypothetical protein
MVGVDGRAWLLRWSAAGPDLRGRWEVEAAYD